MTLLCGCYEISHPAKGYQIIASILEAPVVAGKGSRSNFLLAGFPWEVAGQVDQTRFLFLDRLPFSAWECGSRGCATRLRVTTENGGIIYHGERAGQDMHVCTAELFKADLFVRDGFDDIWPGDEHVRGVLDHEDEIGDRRRVDRAASAGAHDQRDFDFAKHYGLKIRQVITPKDTQHVTTLQQAYIEQGVMINSGQFLLELIDELVICGLWVIPTK